MRLRVPVVLISCFSFLAVINSSLAQSKSDYEKAALRSIGDATRGRELFLDEQRLGCARCHTLEGKATKAGPDLSSIGDKFGRRELIDAVLSPSQSIAVGYSTTSLELKSGELIQGVLKDATDEWIELATADGKKSRIQQKDVASQKISEISLMPEGLQAGLSTGQFTDLIEFLVSLKLPGNATLVHHGMPAEIAMAKEPAAMRPIHPPELKFSNPVYMGEIPDHPGSFMVVEHQTGRIWRLDTGNSAPMKTLFLDLGTNVISGGTRGLIGFVFHPNYLKNRTYYIALHIVEKGVTKTLTLEREAAGDLMHDSGREPKRILEITATSNVHYGGSLMFGPDGYLYIGMGDTGPQEDPRGNGQDISYLRGKILRIDVDHCEGGKLYSIPADNPFVHVSGFRPEIWAYGFREPWRFSFDAATHELWVGDVGQDRYEEVDLVKKGGNYGWNVYEGFEPFSNKYRREGEKYLPPVFAYTRKYGPSVTGGFIYRETRKNSFYGAYIFADYETRRIFALWQKRGALEKIVQIATAPERVVSFGEDSKKQLYVVGYEGTLFRLDLSHAKPK